MITKPGQNLSHPESPESACARAHARLIARRLPAFAATWLTFTLVWSVIIVAKGWSTVDLTAVWLAVQAATLALTCALCRQHTPPARVQPITLAASALVGFTVVTLFIRIEAPSEVLSFLLVALYALAAILFVWGWRNELTLIVATAVPTALALPFGAAHAQPVELWTEVGLGALLTLAAAETGARSFRRTCLSQKREEERTRELARSRDAYRDLAEGARDLVWAVDDAGNWTYANEAMARFFGVPIATLIGRPVREYLTAHPANPNVMTELARVAAGEITTPQLAQCATITGPRWVETSMTAIFAPDGHFVGASGISRDVTERIAAEEKLSASEARYRGLVESQQDLIARIDHEGHLTFANDSYCRSLGLSRENAIGMDFRKVVHEDDLPRIGEEFKQLLERPPHRGVTKNRTRTPSGWRWFEWEACAIRDERGRMVEIQTVGRDITERRETELALAESLEKLRLLARRLAAIREEERKRLSFNLHDDVCQELLGINILIESLQQRLGPLPAKTTAEFGRVKRYLGETTDRLRDLAQELQPLALRDLGLEGALRSLADRSSSDWVRVVTKFPEHMPRIAEDSEVALYRIVQEALSNALRHASPRSVVITLALSDGTLHLEVSDDGRGFDNAERPTTLGILGMEERALAIAARFTIRSQPGRGTTVSLDCPLQ